MALALAGAADNASDTTVPIGVGAVGATALFDVQAPAAKLVSSVTIEPMRFIVPAPQAEQFNGRASQLNGIRLDG
jgi:hypothetical protein